MQSYFSKDYFEARTRFRQRVSELGGCLESLPITSKGPNGAPLAIDIACFGAVQPSRVLVHSSGLHGVEGFAGSAIQLQLLNELPTIPKDAALIISHILNPYGMAWLRRVNEANVDLNRNFLEGESYSGAPATYDRCDSFLNPQSPPSRDLFLAKASLLILRYGMRALKQAIAGGQYEYPRGLFFGGKELQQELSKYRTFLESGFRSVERVTAIDVHTGLGKGGEDTLLVDSGHFDAMRRKFGSRVTPLQPESGPAYKIRGDFQFMIFRVFSKADVSFVGQEFGTYGPITTVHALREENRWHHYGEGTLQHPTKHVLKGTFCPDDESWRRSVLTRGGELLADAISLL